MFGGVKRLNGVTPLSILGKIMAEYIESIIIRQDNRPEAETPLFEDGDCDTIFKFEGNIKLVQILKSVQNADHNKHNYVFSIESIDKLEEEG